MFEWMAFNRAPEELPANRRLLRGLNQFVASIFYKQDALTGQKISGKPKGFLMLFRQAPEELPVYRKHKSEIVRAPEELPVNRGPTELAFFSLPNFAMNIQG